MRQILSDAEKTYMSTRGNTGALDEIRKAVAVGVACLEQHGVPPRNSGEPPINLDGYREAGSSLAA